MQTEDLQPQQLPQEDAEDDEILGLNNFKDTWDELNPPDIPIFWHLPETGGNSIRGAMAGCHWLLPLQYTTIK